MARETLTITLTDRPPVRIQVANWPIIAKAKRWDNQHECQANRVWRLIVRQHEDGRSIVSGDYSSQYQGEHGRAAGELLEAGADVAAAIRRIGERLDFERGLIDDCIADLPPVEI